MSPRILDLSGVNSLHELNDRLRPFLEQYRDQLSELIAAVPPGAKEYIPLTLYLTLHEGEIGTFAPFFDRSPQIRAELTRVFESFVTGFHDSPMAQQMAEDVRPVFGYEQLPSIAGQTKAWLDEMHFDGYGMGDALRADLASMGIGLRSGTTFRVDRECFFPTSLNLEAQKFGPEHWGAVHIPDIHLNTVAWLEDELDEEDCYEIGGETAEHIRMAKYLALDIATRAQDTPAQEQRHVVNKIDKPPVPLENFQVRAAKYLALKLAAQVNEIRSTRSIGTLVPLVEIFFLMVTSIRYKGRIAVDTDIPRAVVSEYKEGDVEGFKFFDPGISMLMEAGVLKGMTMKLSAEVLGHAIAEALFNIAGMEGDPMTLDLEEARDRILANKENWPAMLGHSEEFSRAFIEKWLKVDPFPELMKPLEKARERFKKPNS